MDCKIGEERPRLENEATSRIAEGAKWGESACVVKDALRPFRLQMYTESRSCTTSIISLYYLRSQTFE